MAWLKKTAPKQKSGDCTTVATQPEATTLLQKLIKKNAELYLNLPHQQNLKHPELRFFLFFIFVNFSNVSRFKCSPPSLTPIHKNPIHLLLYKSKAFWYTFVFLLFSPSFWTPLCRTSHWGTPHLHSECFIFLFFLLLLLLLLLLLYWSIRTVFTTLSLCCFSFVGFSHKMLIFPNHIYLLF